MLSKSQGTSFTHIVHLFKLYYVLSLIFLLKYTFQQVEVILFKTALMLASGHKGLREYVICYFVVLLLFYLKKINKSQVNPSLNKH